MNSSLQASPTFSPLPSPPPTAPSSLSVQAVVGDHSTELLQQFESSPLRSAQSARPTKFISQRAASPTQQPLTKARAAPTAAPIQQTTAAGSAAAASSLSACARYAELASASGDPWDKVPQCFPWSRSFSIARDTFEFPNALDGGSRRNATQGAAGAWETDSQTCRQSALCCKPLSTDGASSGLHRASLLGNVCMCVCV